MSDDRLERLLRGYRLPNVSHDLDLRVLQEGAAILERARHRVTMEQVGRTVLLRLGFGYLTLLIDFVTQSDAEYRVEFL